MAKRGRKPKSTTERKGYFYETEESAFVEYLNAESQQEKTNIFNEKLKEPFSRMIESIIRRYRLQIPDEEFNETFNDTMSFMLTKADKFNPDSGYKAYSYCGTICKNYLLMRLGKYNKNLLRSPSYDVMKWELDENSDYSYECTLSDKNKLLDDLISGMQVQIRKMIDNSERFKLNENEKKIGEILINLLSDWDNLFAVMGSNKYNKSAIFLYIKELTLLNQSEVSKGMKKYKAAYANLKKRLLDTIYD